MRGEQALIVLAKAADDWRFLVVRREMGWKIEVTRTYSGVDPGLVGRGQPNIIMGLQTRITLGRLHYLSR